jgi:DNA invertase Pin-like site-specific DNA recombinase
MEKKDIKKIVEILERHDSAIVCAEGEGAFIGDTASLMATLSTIIYQARHDFPEELIKEAIKDGMEEPIEAIDEKIDALSEALEKLKELAKKLGE